MYWYLILGRTDSRSDAGNRQACHGILDQVWAARPEEGGGLGVFPRIVARVVDAADGRRRSSVSVLEAQEIHGVLWFNGDEYLPCHGADGELPRAVTWGRLCAGRKEGWDSAMGSGVVD